MHFGDKLQSALGCLALASGLITAGGAALGCAAEESETAKTTNGKQTATLPPPCSGSGIACRYAGTQIGGLSVDGDKALLTRFYWPVDLHFGKNGVPYLIDWNNHKIREVAEGDAIETIIGTELPGDGADLKAPIKGVDCAVNHPTQLLNAPDGAIYIAAWHNHKIRRWDPATGMIQTIYGSGPGFAGDGGSGKSAKFNQPKALALSKGGDLFVSDQRNFRVRKFTPDGKTSTVVGKGTKGYSGDGGKPLEAELNFEAGGNPEPSGGLVVDASDRLYIADSENHRIRRVDFATDLIETIAGTGEGGYSGDGAAATAAKLNKPRDLEIGPDGHLYLADTENHRIRAIDLTSGIIRTVVGSGVEGSDGEGKPAAEIQLRRPFGLAFDAKGNLYVADTFNNRFLVIAK